MTQLALTPPGPEELAMFFENIHESRNKNSLTHGLHPYPAKFIPHIPRILIDAYTSPGATVLDPMCGSGTSLVEAATRGRLAVGVDLNPVAVLVSRAKTTPLDPNDRRELTDLATGLVEAKQRFLAAASDDPFIDEDELPRFPNRSKWFEREALVELQLVRAAVSNIPTAAARTLALATLSAIIVKASNQESETRWAAKRNLQPRGQVIDHFVTRLQANVRRVEEYQALSPEAVAVSEADARAMPLRSGSIDLILTSPPYANSHDYYLYNKLRLFWLGRDVMSVQSSEIGSRHRHSDKGEGIDVYETEMTEVMTESRRVLKSGAHAVVVVADAVVRGEFFPMDKAYGVIGERAGFDVVDSFRFAHQRFNSAFQRGFGTKMRKKTHVMVFRAA